MTLEDPNVLRLPIFLSVLLVMAVLELLIPKRDLVVSKSKRWVTNILIGGIGSALVRVMGMVALPIVAISAAVWRKVRSGDFFTMLT